MTDVSNTENEDVKKEIGALDPNFPLLKEFREKAPGSYKHSQSVTSIVENVSASIDMDPGPLQLAAMYHDIGKMWAPLLYSENQPQGENIHDGLDSELSYHLITRHVSDSVTIMVANDFNMKEINIVSQHHGTTILRSLYEKETKNKKSNNIYRYKTQKPKTIEALIIMLCDTLEAASRSIYGQQNLEIDPKDLVSQTFSKLMLDGQFDNVEIKLGFLGKIQKTLATDISAMFHKRIEYEENKETNDE